MDTTPAAAEKARIATVDARALVATRLYRRRRLVNAVALVLSAAALLGGMR